MTVSSWAIVFSTGRVLNAAVAIRGSNSSKSARESVNVSRLTDVADVDGRDESASEGRPTLTDRGSIGSSGVALGLAWAFLDFACWLALSVSRGLASRTSGLGPRPAFT